MSGITGDWTDEAICLSVGPETFHPAPGESPKDAKRVCQGCPVREKCLDVALQHDWYGVWGGTTQMERRRLRRQAAAGVA